MRKRVIKDDKKLQKRRKIRFLLKTNAVKIIELNKTDYYVHETNEPLMIQKFWLDWKYTSCKKGYFTKPLIKIKMKVLSLTQDWTQKTSKTGIFWFLKLIFHLDRHRTREKKDLKVFGKTGLRFSFKKNYFQIHCTIHINIILYKLNIEIIMTFRVHENYTFKFV